MIGSLWRYSHFFLAFFSSIFLIIASVTGALLAIEPISDATKQYSISNLNDIHISEVIPLLKENYIEVLELEITKESYVKASVFTETGDSKIIYINPINGDELGEEQVQSPFFSFVTTLHRSLFLKSTGRIIVGITSLLLFLIAFSGFFLMIQRQGGIKKWFVKVKEQDFNQRYHVILSRWFLVPIIIVSITGVYLSAEKFSILPVLNIEHDWSAEPSKSKAKTSVSEFDEFQKISLNEVQKISFPFSNDEEEYFHIILHDREILVHQFTGEIMSEVAYPLVQILSKASMLLHTGKGNVIWAIILMLSSLSLLFFIFSGFAMSIKNKRKSKFTYKDYGKNEANYIILVGSETGTTYDFADRLYNAIKAKGEKVFMDTLNNYDSYENATHLIVLSSTYGDGDAPSNARKFESLISSVKQKNKLQFSVIGFGSMDYPNFCSFAIRIEELLNENSNFAQVSPLKRVNNQSDTDFLNWVNTWNKNSKINFDVSPRENKENIHSKQTLKVIQKTRINSDDTFLIRLRPRNNEVFQSGDLLSIFPPEEKKERYYSIARIKNDILLSVKLHDKGICSNYLHGLQVESDIVASIKQNESFHFPVKSNSVWLIANGTGIAPYLGMLQENNKTPIQLIWGARKESSFDLYRDILKGIQTNNIHLAFSRTNDKKYVQDILIDQQLEVAKSLKSGSIFMVCGSINMLDSVLQTLNIITLEQLGKPFSDFEKNGQLLVDCY